MFRNIVSVTKNVVSMPYTDNNGAMAFKEVSIFDKTYDIDSGPNQYCNNVIEIKLIDRLFTLYTHDNILMEKFHIYISKILDLKEEINARQKQEDRKLDEFMKYHQKQLQNSNLSVKQKFKPKHNINVNA